MRLFPRAVLAALLLTLISTPLLAQGASANLTGTVKDPSGAVLPGVTFTARHIGTNVTRSSATTEDGLYRLTRWGTRPIGKDSRQMPDATQSLHPTVLERWDADPNYRPENLRDYLVDMGDPRAGGV